MIRRELLKHQVALARIGSMRTGLCERSIPRAGSDTSRIVYTIVITRVTP